jgi:hypothetical protein
VYCELSESIEEIIRFRVLSPAPNYFCPLFFNYFLLQKPGCYFVIGNGDGAHRSSGHGPGPCMLHQPELRLQRRADSDRGLDVGMASGKMAQGGPGGPLALTGSGPIPAERSRHSPHFNLR